MKAWMAAAATMLVGVDAPGLDRVVPLPVYAAEQVVDQAAKVVAEMRKALGGAKLDQVKSLSVEGPFRRQMGQRDVEGTVTLVLVGPDKMHRLEEMQMGPAMIERTQALNGDTSWTDMQNRGGMGGGMQIVMRDGPPGAPGADPAEAEKRRTTTFKTEMQRWMFALLGTAAGEITYVGVAESPDGKADMIEMKDARGQALRLFVDQATHLPLMLSYQEIRPRIMMQGGPGGRRGGLGGPGGPGGPGSGTGGGAGGAAGPGTGGGAPAGEPAAGGGERQRPSPEEMQRRMAAMPPPTPSAMQMSFEDYSSVDGVKVPKRITVSADGKPVEEWTLEKIKVNPSVKADLFEKK